LVAAAKFLVAATRNLFVLNFVAVTKPFFFRVGGVTCLFWVALWLGGQVACSVPSLRWPIGQRDRRGGGGGGRRNAAAAGENGIESRAKRGCRFAPRHSINASKD